MSITKLASATLLFFLTIGSPAEADRIITVNFSTATLTVTDEGQSALLFSTRVVLPKGDYYTVPVTGIVRNAGMGPTWTPTAKMHRDMPGRYRKSYGPYEPGNAMGHCKLNIDFHSDEPIMNYVRIHGNAQEKDLGQRVSRSCIRIPDSLCQKLVDRTNEYNGKVWVNFVR